MGVEMKDYNLKDRFESKLIKKGLKLQPSSKITFTNDPNTGYYRPSSDILSIIKYDWKIVHSAT